MSSDSDSDSFFSKNSDEYQNWTLPANQKELIDQISNFIELKEGKTHRKIPVFTFMQNMKSIENSLQKVDQDQELVVYQQEKSKEIEQNNQKLIKCIQEHQEVFKEKFLEEIEQKRQVLRSQVKKKLKGGKKK